MEIYQLRTFVMVANEGNLTRASKRLHASQPAVSSQIKTLEEELGIPLFIRTPKGMVLTENGAKLQNSAQRVLASVADMEKEATLLRGVLRGTLRIGINIEPHMLKVTELFTSMSNQHPYLQLHFHQAMTCEVFRKLEEEELDAGFVYGQVELEKFFSSQLCQVEMVVGGAHYLQETFDSASAQDLAEFQWISTPESCPFYAVSSSFFDRLAFRPQQVAIADDESIIREMAKNGTGICLLPRHDAMEGHPDERLAIWDKEKLYLPLSLCMLERRKNDLALQALFSIVSKIWH